MVGKKGEGGIPGISSSFPLSFSEKNASSVVVADWDESAETNVFLPARNVQRGRERVSAMINERCNGEAVSREERKPTRPPSIFYLSLSPLHFSICDAAAMTPHDFSSRKV